MAVSSPAVHGHASLGPSSAARWTACPGSVERSRGVHSDDTPASLRGTRAHSLAEIALNLYYNTAPQDFVETAVRGFDDWHREYRDAEDFEELCGVADEYVTAVRTLVDDLGSGTTVLVEERVQIPGPEGAMWGTADCLVYNRIYGVLHVFDLKAGKGVRVVAPGNLQLKMYSLGALYRIDPSLRTIHDVYCHIVQPAFDGETMEHYTVTEMVEFKGWLTAKAEAALDPDAPIRPGDVQCRWCPVRDTCPEHLDFRIKDWFGSSGVPPANPGHKIDESDLHRHLEMREKARAYISAVDSAVQANLDHIPSGWTRRSTYRTKVTKPAVLADRLRKAGYEPTEMRLKPIPVLRKECGGAFDLLAGDAVDVTETISVRRCRDS